MKIPIIPMTGRSKSTLYLPMTWLRSVPNDLCFECSACHKTVIMTATCTSLYSRTVWLQFRSVSAFVTVTMTATLSSPPLQSSTNRQSGEKWSGRREFHVQTDVTPKLRIRLCGLTTWSPITSYGRQSEALLNCDADRRIRVPIKECRKSKYCGSNKTDFSWTNHLLWRLKHRLWWLSPFRLSCSAA